MKINWNFVGGGGRCKTKNLWGEYGHNFLELHNNIEMPHRVSKFGLKFTLGYRFLFDN